MNDCCLMLMSGIKLTNSHIVKNVARSDDVFG